MYLHLLELKGQASERVSALTCIAETNILFDKFGFLPPSVSWMDSPQAAPQSNPGTPEQKITNSQFAMTYLHVLIPTVGRIVAK